MNTDELNQKLANWIDLRGILPDFTHSLDTCFMWLVSVLNRKGMRIHMLSQPRGSEDFFCSIGGKWITYGYAYAETPSLALCLALEELINRGRIV